MADVPVTDLPTEKFLGGGDARVVAQVRQIISEVFGRAFVCRLREAIFGEYAGA